MLIAGFANGQNRNLSEIEVTPPQFTGILNSAIPADISANALIKNYLQQNIQYPENSLNCGKQGTVVVQFTVNTEGNLSDFDIINSVCPEIDNEVVQTLKTTDGMWLPGSNNGKPVEMTKEISLVFAVNSNPYKTTNEIFRENAIHYFENGTKALYQSKNVKKAMKNFSNGITYLPYDKSLLLLRGMCRYELGDKEGARFDWDRMMHLGGNDMSDYMVNLKEMKGYNELSELLKK